jgi:spermidine/putrescine transport system substrate-binding protein
MLTDMRDTVGLWMLHTGKSLSNPSFDDAAEAFDIIEKATADGQIRNFTGNDYQDDLISGNFVANVAWSGDIAQLQLDNPSLRFVVPESGSTLWSDTMVIPRRSPHLAEAAAWMNWVYDPVNAARIAAYVGYMSPVDGVRDILAASTDDFEKSLAENELMFPSAETLANTDSWGRLSDEVEAQFDERFSGIVGAS